MELRSAFDAGDMWELVENFQRQHGGGPDVARTRTLATSGAVVLRALGELCDGAVSDAVVIAAKQWLAANAPAV